MSEGGFHTATLPNGLRVVTEERRHAPVVSFWAGYRVGSRNEPPGLTGASHWIEHMLFKPTDAFPNNERDRLISREGGMTNAFTWIDGTAYFTTIPSAQADLVYRIEADRMAASRFEPEVVETERTVILAERDSYENQPDWRLAEQVTALAFQIHPYRHEVIGLAEDLRRMTRDELHSFYKTYYGPHNATLVVVGDFDTIPLLRRLDELFGSIPPGNEIPQLRVGEPEPAGERRVMVEGPGATSHVEVSFRAPASGDPDFVSALLLGTILGGPVGLGFSGGGDSRSSRFYRTLIEAELAVDVDCSLEATIDPFVFDISVMLRAGRSHDEVERAVLGVLNDVAGNPVPDAELAKAKKQVTVQHVFANERITNRAMMLILAHTAFSPDLLNAFEERVSSVTTGDIRRVAERLFRKQNRVVGWYVPDGVSQTTTASQDMQE